MKKFISLILVVVMVASMAAMNVSAEPMLLFADNFATENPLNWIYDEGVTNFECVDGWLKGDSGAVVHQSEHRDENNGNKEWDYCSFSVDIMFEDYDSVRDDFFGGLWWKDYQLQEGVEYFPGDDISSGTVYELRLYTETRRVVLSAEWGSILPETTTVEGQEVEVVEKQAEVAVYELPADYELNVDYTNPSIVNLGMRIEPNRIRGYLDGQQVIDYTPPTTIGNMKPSPLILVNGGLMIGFDNFQAATNDYILFEADKMPETTLPVSSDPAPAESKEPETSVVIKTEIVSDTDGSGNVITSVVENSEVVTVPPVANTNPTPSTGGSSTATGDMAFVVVAVMIVALGTAVVVKKANVK